LHSRPQLLVHATGDSLLYQQPRACTANLTLVEPDGVYHPSNNTAQVSVLEHDERALAAKRQAKRLPAARSCPTYLATNLGRSRARTLGHVRMPDERARRPRVSRHDG